MEAKRDGSLAELEVLPKKTTPIEQPARDTSSHRSNKRPQHKANKCQITMFDVFAGCGAVSVGCEKAGWHTTAMIDNDRTCAEVCRRAFPHARVYWNNATTASFRATVKAANPSVVWLSPPCQPSSSLNLNKKEHDPRAQAAVESCKHVISVRPPLILIENVVGTWIKFRLGI